MRDDKPLVIGHRGACGYRPEHTLPSYRLAIEQGADFVEPDLVATRDGVLVARHENEISGTTDVATRPEFAGRMTTKTIGGREVTGWFTEDFTLAELKSLRAVERLALSRPGNTRYDGLFEVPTFAEVLDLVEAESERRGEVVGVYPELKHPAHFAAQGLPLAQLLLRMLRGRHLDRPNAEVFVQCFDPATLRWLAGTATVPLVQLVGLEGRALLSRRGLRELSTCVRRLGVHQQLVTRALVADAHAAGLEVHAWTLRGGAEEYARVYAAGVDGVFSDHPDIAVAARSRLLAARTATAAAAHSSGIRIHATT